MLGPASAPAQEEGAETSTPAPAPPPQARPVAAAPGPAFVPASSHASLPALTPVSAPPPAPAATPLPPPSPHSHPHVSSIPGVLGLAPLPPPPAPFVPRALAGSSVPLSSHPTAPIIPELSPEAAAPASSAPAPPAPPEDLLVLKTIHNLATFVAKSGRSFENVVRKKNEGAGESDPKFRWLFNTESSEYKYYLTVLAGEEAKLAAANAPASAPSSSPTASEAAPGETPAPGAEATAPAPAPRKRKSRFSEAPPPGVPDIPLPPPPPPMVMPPSADDDDIADDLDFRESLGDDGGPIEPDAGSSIGAMNRWMKVLESQAEAGRKKHHIGDHLPEGELKKFLAKQRGEHIDDDENKLDSSNLGYKLLSKLGWQEGSGLGRKRAGMTAPIAAEQRAQGVGLGADQPGEIVPSEGDDAFTSYKKRMALSYRYRPNPFNNPRTAYWQDPAMNKHASSIDAKPMDV